MSNILSCRVAGVDGCKKGWVVAVASVMSEGDESSFGLRRFLVARDFAEVLSETGECELVCVDIPIGLSDSGGPRECDIAARRVLGGKRASSVFTAPVRACLSAGDYETASAISFEYSGKKLSKQSFALFEKIRQVDDLMTPALQDRVREIHPEVSFWALNGGEAIPQNKKTVPGQACRHGLLFKIFTELDGVLAESPASGFVMDDALDALVAAWTAGLVVAGRGRALPDEPELDGKGLRMEIVYPDTQSLGPGQSGMQRHWW
jgi:predicted RNase H-like nuclease